MRYHYKPPIVFFNQYGFTYICNHEVYSKCTLYKIGELGLAVIQQYYIPETKATYWSEVEAPLVDDIYLKDGFIGYFKKYASKPDKNGLYPTVTVRQIMWALRFKPLQRRKWETVFDKVPI